MASRFRQTARLLLFPGLQFFLLLPFFIYPLFIGRLQKITEYKRAFQGIHIPYLSYFFPCLRFRLAISKESFSRKEVFQPHLPVRLPCYDLAPITSFALGRSLRSRTSGTPGFHGLTGGVYKARERIHRAMADARLLANPASWGRVADPSPN